MNNFPTTTTTESAQRYQAFLVRFWQSERGVWHVYIRDVQTNTEQTFGTVQELFTFFALATQQSKEISP